MLQTEPPGQNQSVGTQFERKINGAYLTKLPIELVRSMADFPTYDRFFCLTRAALNPPTSLWKKLFPAIGEWHDRLAAKELSPGDPI
ncbi:hypothetical protein [Absidia glauca]|uniref:Ndc10 domain-containing protein n=1 Tax=Absidia glauca TaxID=4829 RepID=A0A168MTA7_ABSGL|nr:hypothetical protein [Absidia glauca]